MSQTTDQQYAHYGDIRENLESKGTITGENDLHIGAHARSEGLILMSNTFCEPCQLSC